MRAFLVLTILLFSLSGFSQSETEKQQVTTYFLIRHAEKDTSDPRKRDPELTEEGKNRAKKWAEILSDADIDFVFTTDYSRTRNTASPIAELKDLELIMYDPRDLNNADFRKKTKGKTSVIVGHSNTTPAFVNKIIGSEKYSPLEEQTYGKLFIVTIKNNTVVDIVLAID